MKHLTAPITSIADIEATEQIPLSHFQLPDSTYQAISNSTQLYPNKIALRFFLQGKQYQQSHNYTYQELLGHIHQTANLFHDLGIGSGDVVAFLLPNLPQTHFIIWGAETAGIVCPINPLLEGEQIVELVSSAKAKVLITLAPFPGSDIWTKIEKILPQLSTVHTILTVHLGDYFKFPSQGLPQLSDYIRTLGKAHFDFNQHKLGYAAEKLVFERKIAPSDVAAYFHTGGTTGLPKLARQTHANQVFDSWAALQFIGGNRENTTFFCGLPLFHVNAVINTGLVPFLTGATVVLGTPQGYRGEGVLENFWQMVEHYQVTFFSGVPTIYQVLLSVPQGQADISSLEFGFCGAAPMPAQLISNFEVATGVKILEGYGLTEATCVSAINPGYGTKKAGSVGLRLPYQSIKIVLLDSRGRFVRECTIGEAGVVVIAGPNVFAGYSQESYNAQLWIEIEGQKWLNTGDLGSLDADGYLKLSGRKKELIIRGGHNIDPAWIEEPLLRHKAVAIAAAVGKPDARLGELPVAYVQLKPGQQVAENELWQFLKQHVGEKSAIPQSVHIIPQMPLTAVGKVFKPALVALEIKKFLDTLLHSIPHISVAQVEILPAEHSGMMAVIGLEPEPACHEQTIQEMLQKKLGTYAIPIQIKTMTAGS